MSNVIRLVLLLAAMALAACGGGGGAKGDPPFGSPTPTGSSTPVASDISITLSSSVLNNDGTSTVTATVTAVDGNRNALSGIPITVGVDANAIATVSSTTTDSSGEVTAQIGVGADRTNRVVTVTASSGSISRQVSLTVRGATLTASYSPSVTTNSTNNTIEYKLVDANAVAMTQQNISVSGPGLPTASGTTDSLGKFTYTYTAPATAGSIDIVATGGGAPLTTTISVLDSGGPPGATSFPESASLAPNPSVISVNAIGKSDNQVELRALFLGSSNQPIKNIRVRFDLAGNANSTDGVATQVGTFAYSDTNGVARGTFTPGQKSSPTNGVTVRACYDVVDFATTACPHSVTNTLTVVSEALSVNIRTDNTVGEGSAKLTYTKRFAVMVVDAAGQAKAGVPITASVDLPSYYKGFFTFNGKQWVRTITLANTEAYTYNANGSPPAWQNVGPTSQPSCPNEDVNRNGVREADPYDPNAAAPPLANRQEDLNWNGELDPRKADVAVTMVGGSTTDSTGVAVVQIEYGKNLAGWVDFVITVTASGISGSEARAKYSGLVYGVGGLPYPGTDVVTEVLPPAFAVSPYGRSTVCTDAQ